MNELTYLEVDSKRHAGPSNLFIIGSSSRALRFDHPTARWVFDPRTVVHLWEDDFEQGEDRINAVDRGRAEEVARLLGAALPSVSELRQVLQDGEGGTP